MSKPASAPIDRSELLRQLMELGRSMSTQTVFLHQAIANGAGLNATETKCIDLILRSAETSVTAGWIAEVTGLTTGAITHILDRLEQRQFVERIRDAHDRRKVRIRVRPESLESLAPRYEAIGQAYMAMLEQYSDKELRLICDYLRKTSEVSEKEMARLIAANRAKAKPSKRRRE